MKIILVGYPGSQHIVPASKYLTRKYLPDFHIRYLSWAGPKDGWSNFVGSYLAHLKDKLVILALDDYLLSSPLSPSFDFAIQHFKRPEVVCVKLCPNTYEEHQGYPVTTQYTIWRKDYLVKLLAQTANPWDFEMRGSAIMKNDGKVSALFPCLEYNTSSALSSRWQGVDFKGVSQEDSEYINNNLL